MNCKVKGPNCSMKRFLLFYAGDKRGYYQDTRHFTEEISRELRRRGHQTFIWDLVSGFHDTDLLTAHKTAGVDVVLTFNGEAIAKEELWQCWNRLGALVVNILMDPPFHIDLCSYMENPCIERYLVLCPDENHVKWVQHFFPQVKHVDFMPHGGTPVKGRPIPWKEKSMALLFCGTYIKPEKFIHIMAQTMRPDARKTYIKMAERILQDLNLSVEQVVTETLFAGNESLDPEKVRKELPGMNLLEGWARTGYEKALAFTWENYVEDLLVKIERCQG